MKQIRFDGKVAVVTGAGGGLGRVYALDLAKRGAKVVVNDFGGATDGEGKPSSLFADRVVAEIKAMGGDAVANDDSVATPEGGARIINTALTAFSGIDILINNAGIMRDKEISNMAERDWGMVMDVHLNGAYHVTRPAFMSMREKGYGRIVMITSAAGLYGSQERTNYSAAKMGVVGFMNSLKIEGEPYNIKVNAVAPLANSRLLDLLEPSPAVTLVREKGLPEFVSPMTLFLCSEECPSSGDIYNAGMGFFNRVALMNSRGTVIGTEQFSPTVEDVAAHWEEIVNMDAPEEYRDGMGTLFAEKMFTAHLPKK